jgi:phosphonate transport system substrate-binding protein
MGMTRSANLTPYVFALTVVLILGLVPPRAQAVDKDGTLVFGFLPILSTQKLVERFKPMVDLLSENLHRPIRMETSPNYKVFIKRTRAKRYDILFTAPHLYYLAHVESGYHVIVRVNAKSLRAVIVASKASHVKTLRGLKGKKIATPDHLSLGTALIRNSLREAGLNPDKDVTIVSTPSHNAALITAYDGITDAAGLMVPPYQRASKQIHNSMVVLATTIGTAHMPIAVSPTLKPEIAKTITTTLTTLKQTSKGRALLKHLAWPMGFTRAKDSEYAPLKNIIHGLHLK